MTAAERLLALAGTTGTAAALLLAIGTGATAGAALVDYSGLASATAAEHLLEDVISSSPPFIGRGGGGYLVELDAKPKRETITLYDEEAEILELLAVIMPVIQQQQRRATT